MGLSGTQGGAGPAGARRLHGFRWRGMRHRASLRASAPRNGEGGFMRKAWKWLGRLAAVVLVLLAVVLLSAYGLSERRMAKVYRIDPPVPAVRHPESMV